MKTGESISSEAVAIGEVLNRIAIGIALSADVKQPDDEAVDGDVHSQQGQPVIGDETHEPRPVLLILGKVMPPSPSSAHGHRSSDTQASKAQA